ncbi:hypothetical protein J5U23_01345 [Saccharolobus shibatae B12]|uniref:Uncharacterized protein n=1 Tax=Saccharolobus shibatae (strain ATCC 51178 / DSM 5389 / JCM 8931 / NBRC 15437 / B12) TaxID=523848 RepID=A0A8F5BNF0_SACSH|nr:hypothetical protein J5U23_01345 [Saccharolobus shibatae B12]
MPLTDLSLQQWEEKGYRITSMYIDPEIPFFRLKRREKREIYLEETISFLKETIIIVKW